MGSFPGRRFVWGRSTSAIIIFNAKMEEMKNSVRKNTREKKTFKKDHHFICRNTYMNISNDTDSGKFYPMRAIRWVSVIIITINIIFNTSWSGAT